METAREELNTGQAFRFHAVALHNNMNRLARIMIDNPDMGFLINAVTQANEGTYVNPEGNIEEACRSEQHYQQTIRELEYAVRRNDLEEPGPRNLETRVILYNSIVQCERILATMEQEREQEKEWEMAQSP